MSSPVVEYRCTVRGCGLRLATIEEFDARPRFVDWPGNSLGAKGDGEKRIPLWFIDAPMVDLRDEGRILKEISIGCRRHGYWTLTHSELLADWDRRPMARKLSESERNLRLLDDFQ